MKSKFFLTVILLVITVAQVGCEVMPVSRLKPSLHNPFPQLTEVAVVPFFDCTEQQNIDGAEFAQSYASELQRVSGFRVLSVQAVRKMMQTAQITRFDSADDVRRLGNLLGVDAVLVGYVNEYSPYYPPRIAIKVDWYSVNPYFQAIPNGYGLPWGTESAQEIPQKIVEMAEHDLARIQLKTQTPTDTSAAKNYDYEMQRMVLQREIEEKSRMLGIDPSVLYKLYNIPQNTSPQGLPKSVTDGSGNNGSDEDASLDEYEMRQRAAIQSQFQAAGVPPVWLSETNALQEKIVEAETSSLNVGNRPQPVPGASGWSMRNRSHGYWDSMKPTEEQPSVSPTAPNIPIVPTVPNSPATHLPTTSTNSAPVPYPYQNPYQFPYQNPYPAASSPESAGVPEPEESFYEPLPQMSAESLAAPSAAEVENFWRQQSPSVPSVQPGTSVLPNLLRPDDGETDRMNTEESAPWNVSDTEYRGQANYPQTPTVPAAPNMSNTSEMSGMSSFPVKWPDARGFLGHQPLENIEAEEKVYNPGPVITHVNVYNANDSEFTQALADYDLLFRDDKRITGWQTVINNRTEFISFCCRLHIWETLMSRGGAGKAAKVNHLWKPWYGNRPY